MSTQSVSNSGRTYWTDKVRRWPGPTSRSGAAAALVGLTSTVLIAAACGSSGGSSAAATATTTSSSPAGAGGASTAGSGVTVKIGYFPNITHAPALVGVQAGIFAKDLGTDKLATPQTFSAGPAENTALLSGSIDIAFEGPSSALSAYSASKAVTIIAGAAAGGAGLVVDSKITSAKQLKGTKLGSPQLANTQDIALRFWLKTQGYTTTSTGGGDVAVDPSSTGSGTVVTEFKSGQIDGAWMAEPYEQELIADGGHLLVPEASLWPNGLWATTNVVVRTAFLKAHPATVSDFLKGLVDTLAFMKSDRATAEADANEQLATLEGGKPLSASVLAASWDNITFTDDPLASTLETQVKHGEAVGLLKDPGDLAPIYTLAPLNAVLAKAGQPAVAGL
jgi:NitT/TauT family transport system substrate-binding protein